MKQPVDIKNAEDAEKLTITSLETYYKAGDLDLDVSFYGIDNDSKYYDDISLPSKDDEITISYDFAQKIFEIRNIDIKVNPVTSEEYKRTAPRPTYSVLDNFMLKLVGLNSFRNWEDALIEYLNEEAFLEVASTKGE